MLLKIGNIGTGNLRIKGRDIATVARGGTSVDVADPAVRRDLNATVGRWQLISTPIDAQVPESTLSTITVPAEGGDDAITVTIQLKDYLGVNMRAARTVHAWLSDDSAGAGVTATAPDTVEDGTGSLQEIVSNKVFLITTNSSGQATIDIGENAAGTWYLAVMMPDGKVKVSGAITFA